MNYKGKKISFTIKGESHSPKICLTIFGLKYDKKYEEIIQQNLKKRNPNLFFNTQRKENDAYEIVEKTDNRNNKNKICVTFRNTNINKKD